MFRPSPTPVVMERLTATGQDRQFRRPSSRGVIEQQRARIAVAVRDLGIVPPVTAGRFAAISQGRNEPVTR